MAPRLRRRREPADQARRVKASRRTRAGRVLLAVAVLAMLVVPAVLLADPVSYVPLIATVLLAAVSWAYLRVLRRSLAVDVAQMTGTCERGQQAELAVSLANASVLPYPRIQLDFYVTDLFGGYDDVRTFTCALGSREEANLGFDVRFAHLGTYYAGLSRVVVHDLLGLFSSTLDGGARGAVTVRPRKVELDGDDDMRALPDEATRALRAVAADDVDYSSVREYRYGDPLKTVHWNLSARSADGSLYTRVFETFTAPSLTIAIDPCAPDFDDEDLMSLFDGMVEAACALAERANDAGTDAEVRYVRADGGLAGREVLTADDADRLVADMARIVAEPRAGGLADAAEDLVDGAYGAGNVALVTSRPGSAALAALVDVVDSGRDAMALVAVPRHLEGKDRDRHLAPLTRLDEAGVGYFIVESNELSTEVMGL